jgi:hypothetical protein
MFQIRTWYSNDVESLEIRKNRLSFVKEKIKKENFY